MCICSRYGWIIFWAIAGFGCEERTVILSLHVCLDAVVSEYLPCIG